MRLPHTVDPGGCFFRECPPLPGFGIQITHLDPKIRGMLQPCMLANTHVEQPPGAHDNNKSSVHRTTALQ